MILSIDVGIRNLAMCQFDETSNLVVQWDVSGIPPEHKDGIYISLRKHLDERPWVLDSQIILIEKQPDRNKKMATRFGEKNRHENLGRSIFILCL